MAIIKTTNEEGEEIEIEAFTQEEVDAKLAEVKTEYDGKIVEKDKTLDNLAKEKIELEKKIGGVKEDAPNFKVLKEALDKKSTDIDALKGELETDRKSRKESFIDSIISKATHGNEDFEKKIKYHLENTLIGMKDDNDSNLKNKIQAAVKLSLDVSNPTILDGIMGNQTVSSEVINDGKEENKFTPNQKALGNKLGISDEDYKKYGKDSRIK